MKAILLGFTKVDLNWRNFKRVNLIGLDFIKANFKKILL